MAKKRKSSLGGGQEIEWAGTGENPEDWIHDDGFYALQTKNAALLGQYLREARTPDPVIIKKLADLLDPTDKNDPKLKFVEGRGRPVDEGKIHTDGHIRMMVRFAQRKSGKLEAAVADVAKKTGKSRSTIFDVWANFGNGNRSAKKKKSAR